MAIDDVKTTIFQGDDTDAFGRNFIKVNAPKGIESGLISKCVFQCGEFQQTIENPVFPFFINISSDSSKNLDYLNECYLQLYDAVGKRITLRGNMTVIAEKQVVKDTSCESGVRRYARG